MHIFKITAQAVIKRPIIFIVIGVLMLTAAIVNAFIPVMAMVVGIVNMTGGNIFESMLSLLQMLINPETIPTLLVILTALTVVTAIIAGLLLPGFLIVVENAITVGTKKRGSIAEGFKLYFFKIFFITVKTVLLTAFLSLFLMVSAIPSIIVTRVALTTRPELMIAALFIDIMTAGVLFMCLSFYRAYIYMWYIAASEGEKKPFLKGKSIADRQFWDMTLNLLVFDIIFAAAIFILNLCNNQLLRYALGWAFTTAFFTTLAVYLVKTFREGSQNNAS